MTDFTVRIKGQIRLDDGLSIDLGPCSPGEAWWKTALPSCPDCGGELGWCEVGARNTRQCLGKPRDGRYAGGCGSIFNVRPVAVRHVVLKRERFYV